MTKLFKSPTPLMIRLREQLLTVWNDDNEQLQVRIPFSADNPEHIALIRDCTDLVGDKSRMLQTIDIKIVGAFALGIAAFVATWIFPLTYLAVSGFSYGAYQLAKRQQVYADYIYALENLETCCAWSMGPAQENAQVLDVAVIQQMLTTLTPVMNRAQLQRIIAANVQDQAIAQSEQRFLDEIVRNPVLHNASVEQQRALLYRLYGMDQGSTLSILQSVVFIIRHTWRMVVNVLQDEEQMALAPLPI